MKKSNKIKKTKRLESQPQSKKDSFSSNNLICACECPGCAQGFHCKKKDRDCYY